MILKMPSIKKKIDTHFSDKMYQTERSELLKTIIFPKNLMYLTDQLPVPSYDDDDDDFESQVKSSTLPHKKHSGKFDNRKLLSRSKLNSGQKKSENMDYDHLENLSKSSKSKRSKDYSQAKQVMKNNLAHIESSASKVNYKDVLSKQHCK